MHVENFPQPLVINVLIFMSQNIADADDGGPRSFWNLASNSKANAFAASEMI